jgi:DNA polymerase III epsilon subunit-like protein
MFYYVLDTETTGTVVERHEIVEISVIRVDNKSQVSRVIRAKYPERASLDALAVTNKKHDDLLIGETHLEAIQVINKFFNEDGAGPEARVIVGHNICGFDRKFLHTMWAEHGMRFPADNWVDTLDIMRKFKKDNNLGREILINLNASMDLFGLKKVAGASHSAKIDTRNNFFLWLELQKRMDCLPFNVVTPHDPDGPLVKKAKANPKAKTAKAPDVKEAISAQVPTTPMAMPAPIQYQDESGYEDSCTDSDERDFQYED